MKKAFLGISFFLLIGFSGLSQIGVGEWRDHFSLKSVDDIVEYNNMVYASSYYGVIEYNIVDNSVKKLTKANGLSDVGITAMAVDKLGTLVLGYSNGNIDIVFAGKIVNMRDLISKSMTGSKRINNVIINGSKAFFSCEFGILVIDINKLEVSNTYYLSANSTSNSVYNIAILNDTLYAASSQGIYFSPVYNARIQLFSSWKQLSPNAIPYSDIVVFNGGLVMAQGKVNASCFVQYFKNSKIVELFTSSIFKSLSAADKLIITDATAMSVFDPSLSLVKTIFPVDGEFVFSKQSSKRLYAGLSQTGLRIYNDFLSNEGDYINILPNGPNSNLAANVKCSNYGVWLSPGGIASNWGNLCNSVYFSFFDGLVWRSFTSREFPVFNGEWDLFQIALNPNSPADVSFSSWGSGIFRVISNDSVIHYDQYNSILQNIFAETNPGERNYVRVGGIAIDKNGATWMTNAGSSMGGIVVRTADNKWYAYDYESAKNTHSQGQILIGKNGFKWSFFPRTNEGLFVWDDNGTIDKTSDDRYRGSVPTSSEVDSRNVGQLEMWDKNGEVITKVVNCFAEDNDGIIWVGTDKGPVVYYRPSAIFSEVKPIATQINIPRNDGSGLGDFLLGSQSITAITIDAANRKWIGTSTSGVYLLSEDGTNQIEHFSTDNSPLPSNSITSLSVTPNSGEIFIGTSLGLVSYRGTAAVGAKDSSSPIVFPNPITSDFVGPVTIKGMVIDSNVKITDVAGNIVKEMQSLGGQAVWDRTDFNGESVKTGVYFILITNSDGTISGSTKVMIIN